MQSTHYKSVADTPFFPLLLAEEKSKDEKVVFLKTMKKSKHEEVKVYFTPSKIFLVHMKDNHQQRVEIRLRTPLTSLLGETTRLVGEH